MDRIISAKSINKLLINKVYLAKRDDNGSVFDQQAYITQINNWLDKIYNHLSLHLSKSQFIDYSSINFTSKTDHKWGRSPFHFTPCIENIFMSYISNYSRLQSPK